MKQIIDLPNTVINEEARAEELQRFHDIEQFINESLVPAFEKEGFAVDIELLEALKTERAIAEIIRNKEREYVFSLPFCPNEEKVRIRKVFDAVLGRLEGVCTDYARNIKGVKLSLIQAENGQFYFNPDELDKHISSIGVRKFREEEKKLFELYQKLYAAYRECRDYEKEQGLRPFAGNQLWFARFGQGVTVGEFAKWDLFRLKQLSSKYSNERFERSGVNSVGH
ncbi:hypothetical protein [Parabacteroides provencensis]|uniref:hypothetical protein n=1 Tax=Parabacteroides provencensis TaxID=1944636 RepID=UPI000C15AA87|nr:hypothetical protein [Parabacteroides provencensis]